MTFKDLIVKWNGGIQRGASREFAKKIGYSEAIVSEWVRDITLPGEKIRDRIAKELGVTLDQLKKSFTLFETRDAGYPLRQPLTPRQQRNAAAHGQASLAAEPSLFYPVQYVPVIGGVSADRFNVALETPPDDVLPIPVTGPAGKYFALRVSGRCMEPTAHDGQYVVVAQAAEIPDGKLGIFRLNEECTLKRLFRMKDGACELRPDNPKYEKIVVKCGDLKVVGLVIGFFQKP